MKKITNLTNSDQLWSIFGDFDVQSMPVSSEQENMQETGTRKQKVTAQGQEYQLQMERSKNKDGVSAQKSSFVNTSDRTLCIGQLLSKFVFDGGEYEVYTQSNGWQKESFGAWQPLVSTVMVESPKMRFCDGAAPFLAVWNCQTGRGMAFHLLAKGSWQMSASRYYVFGEFCEIVVEVGLNSRNLALEVAPGENVEFPEIIFYEFRNKTDMDCYKLHRYCNNRYPKWRMPVIYNTWLYKFDKINYENVMKQVGPAAEIGAEYFVIDAGWFGGGGEVGWGDVRGDWFESLTHGFCGRMKEVSDAVRAAGMKFGIWLEPEIASGSSEAYRSSPELFIKEKNSYFLDFARKEAVDYIYEIVCGLIEMYQVEFIKFDYNVSMYADPLRRDFVEYFAGYNDFLQRLSARYPGIHLSCCASGGLQSNLSICENYGSIWISDNQSVYHTMRIYKDSILRMPPQMIEKWAAVTSIPDFEPAYGDNPKEKILSTDDATWSRVISVQESMLRGFFQGSPAGLTCDLTKLSPETFAGIKETVREFKEDREFWQRADCRILTDTESLLVMQYSDPECSRVKVLVFTGRIGQQNLTVYPVLCENNRYHLKADDSLTVTLEQSVSGRELAEEGIDIPLKGHYFYTSVELWKEEEV